MSPSLSGEDGTGAHPHGKVCMLAGHATAPSVRGVVCLLLTMMSLASVTLDLGGIPLWSLTLTGSALLGILGWFAVAVIAATVVARLSTAEMPFRSIAATAAWMAVAALAIYQSLNPVPANAAAAMQGVGNLFGTLLVLPSQPDFEAGARGAVQQDVLVSPSIDPGPFVAAGAVGFLRLRRARSAPVATARRR